MQNNSSLLQNTQGYNESALFHFLDASRLLGDGELVDAMMTTDPALCRVAISWADVVRGLNTAGLILFGYASSATRL